MEQEHGELLFVKEVDYITWMKTIDRRSGVNVDDFVAIPFNGHRVDQEEKTIVECAYVLLIHPEAAMAIVVGIATLLEGPRPPDINFPGTN